MSFVLSAKEEVNGAGAKTSAFSLNPTHAIVVDVTFADAPGMPEQPGRAKLGDGPVVSFAPVLDRDTSRALLELAQKENIPALSEADGGRTSTNADDIAVSREGVVTGVVSVPLRYMHSPVEVCLEEDIQAAARLLFHYAHSL